MQDIVKNISESLQIPLSIEPNEDNNIQITVTGENNVNDFNLITFLRGLIGYHLVEKIQYKKNNDELQVSFSIINKDSSKAIINKILTNTYGISSLFDEDTYYDVKAITAKLGVLLLGLYSNGVIEYDVLKQMVKFELTCIDKKVLPVSSAIVFVDKLNSDPNFTKKFINGGNCDDDVMYKITSDEEIQEAAMAYSEGRESLYKLLEFCFSNNIWTAACCKGHGDRDDKSGFVTFNLNYANTREFFSFLANKLVHISLNELLSPESDVYPIPNYPECYVHAFDGFYVGGTVSYEYDYADQILQLILQYGKEFINAKRILSLDNSLSNDGKQM